MIEPLESRSHLSLASDMVAWINAARANPAQACASVGVTLNEGLPAGTITATPKQVVRENTRLDVAAQKEAELILAKDELSHYLNGSPQDRAAAEGYRSEYVIENAGVTISSAVYWQPAGVLYRQHQAYIAHAGHRTQLFDPAVSNVGVGVAIGTWGNSPAMASVILFATPPQRQALPIFVDLGEARSCYVRGAA